MMRNLHVERRGSPGERATRWGTRALRGLGVLGVFALTGCYQYVPIEGDALRAGARVRAHIADPGAPDITANLGPGVTAVDGSVLRLSRDTLGLAVRVVTLRQFDEQYWKGEGVTLPRGVLGQLEERQLSRTRTALFSGAILAGSLMLRRLFDPARGGEDGGVPVRPPAKQ